MKGNNFVSNLVKCWKMPFLCGVLILSGCVSTPGSATKNVHFQDSPGVDTLLIPAEYREVYFNNGEIGDKHCRAPGPDFTVQASNGLSVGGSIPGVPGSSESLGDSSGESALSLGGRSAEVLLARELLYRACELSLNIDANGKQATAIYYRFLDAVIQLSLHQSTIQTSSATDHTSSEAPIINISSSQTSSNSSSNSSSGNNSSGSNSSGNNSSGNNSSGNNSSSNSSEYSAPNSTISKDD